MKLFLKMVLVAIIIFLLAGAFVNVVFKVVRSNLNMGTSNVVEVNSNNTI